MLRQGPGWLFANLGPGSASDTFLLAATSLVSAGIRNRTSEKGATPHANIRTLCGCDGIGLETVISCHMQQDGRRRIMKSLLLRMSTPSKQRRDIRIRTQSHGCSTSWAQFFNRSLCGLGRRRTKQKHDLSRGRHRPNRGLTSLGLSSSPLPHEEAGGGGGGGLRGRQKKRRPLDAATLRSPDRLYISLSLIPLLFVHRLAVSTVVPN